MAPKYLSDSELLSLADQAWSEAIALATSSDGWKQEKKNDRGEIVMSKKNAKGRRVYRVKAICHIKPEKLIDLLSDTSKMTEWNTTLREYKLINQLSDKVTVSYQVTADSGPGGMVSSRDFVLVFKQDYNGKDYVMGGCSIEHKDAPKQSKIVRAWNGPGCQIVHPIDEKTCEFTWLLDCDYKGWIPGSILELALPHAQMMMVDSIQKLVEANK